MFSRTLSLSVLLLGAAASASAQSPWNRTIEAVSIGPGGGAVAWSATITPTSAPLDLSFNLALFVNGGSAPRWLTTIDLDVNPGAGFCGGPAPCGGGCGTGYIDGITAAAFLCLDCSCALPPLLAPIPPQPSLQPGDEIMVILYPASGAVPEFEQDDDVKAMTFLGDPISWDRRIDAVQLQPAAGAPDSFFDIFVDLSVDANYDGELDLAGELDLIIDGVVVDTVPAPGLDLDLAWSQCATLACDDSVACAMDAEGNFWGTCQPDEDGPFDCGCLYHPVPDLNPAFRAILIDPGAAISVVLRPAPGALPELPGFPDDETDVEPDSCPADLNDDGNVNVQDMVALILDWGCVDPPGPCAGDVNGDGVVNVQDLVQLILAWGVCTPV
jgi:hypothetical protein